MTARPTCHPEPVEGRHHTLIISRVQPERRRISLNQWFSIAVLPSESEKLNGRAANDVRRCCQLSQRSKRLCGKPPQRRGRARAAANILSRSFGSYREALQMITLARYALTLCVTLAVLAGCGGSQGALSPPAAPLALVQRLERGTGEVLPTPTFSTILRAMNRLVRSITSAAKPARTFSTATGRSSSGSSRAVT